MRVQAEDGAHEQRRLEVNQNVAAAGHVHRESQD